MIHVSSPSVQVASAAFSVLKAIAGNDDVKKDIFAAGGVPIIVSLWSRHPKRLGWLCERWRGVGGLLHGLLHGLAEHSSCNAVVLLTLLAFLLASLTPRCALAVVINGCAAATALCLRNQDNATAFVKNGVANLVVKAMIMFPKSERLQKEACK